MRHAPIVITRMIKTDIGFQYFFSFFGSGKDALAQLRDIVYRNGTRDKLIESVAELLRSQHITSKLEAEAYSPSRPAADTGVPYTTPEKALFQPSAQDSCDIVATRPNAQDELSLLPSQSSSSHGLSDAPSPVVLSLEATGSQILECDDIFQHEATASPRTIVEPSDRLLSIAHRQDDEHATSSTKTTDSTTPTTAGLDVVPHTRLQSSSSTTTLQDLLRAGTYPLQKASGIAGLLKSQSHRMGALLASESKGYYERVSGMWAGERVHYDASESRVRDEQNEDREDEERGANYGDRFRAHFALPPTERLHASYYGYLHRLIPIYGKIYIGDNKVCFRSLLPGSRTKVILSILGEFQVANECR